MYTLVQMFLKAAAAQSFKYFTLWNADNILIEITIAFVVWNALSISFYGFHKRLRIVYERAFPIHMWLRLIIIYI